MMHLREVCRREIVPQLYLRLPYYNLISLYFL